MEILSFNFAIFVVKIAFCTLPIVLGFRLYVLSSETKEETRRKISKKLLKDPNLLEQGFYNFVLYFIGSIIILMGVTVALLLFI
tara:strand:+ start:444 stop:695 length:252 start_codon:yes stop_codon:yes gene_type:complete